MSMTRPAPVFHPLCSSLGLALLLCFAGCDKKPESRMADKAAALKPVETKIVEEVKPPPPAFGAAAPAAELAAARSADASAANELKKTLTANAASSTFTSPIPTLPTLPALPTMSNADKLSSGIASGQNDGEHKFIRSASANFLVKDVYRSALALEDIAAKHNGFVLHNEIESREQRHQSLPIANGKKLEISEYVVNGTLVMRIPSSQSQQFLRDIAAQMVFLDKRSFNAHDAQFDLLRQQLEYRRNQESQEDLGQIVNDDKRNPSLERNRLMQKSDIVQSRSQFKAARDEAIIAQKIFSDNIHYSTIELNLRQLPALQQSEVQDIEAVFAHYRPSFASRVQDALAGGWEGLLDFSVGLLSAWPLLTVLAVAGLAWRARRAKRKA